MILVTLGTQDKEFKRLLVMVQKMIDRGVIKDKVIAQVGCTSFESKNMEIYDYLSKEDMQKYIKDADYVICHGGVGTIIDSLNNNKKVISVARLKEYGEHHNDHQLEIVSEFRDLGFILDGTYNLESAIISLKDFKPKKYKSNNKEFVKTITDFIDNN